MKKIILLILLSLICSLALADEAKIDSLLSITKDTGEKVNLLYDQYKNDPLADKTWGVEFNFVRLLTIKDKTTTLSGGFSYFGKPGMEIYIPWYYYRYNEEEDELEDLWYNDFYGKDKVFYTDARVRMFTGNTSNGFFMSALTRFAYLESSDQNFLIDSTFKWGVGVGIGWRSFSYRGFNWGFSLSAGRYFTGKENVLGKGVTSILFLEEASNDTDIFFDIEILKFGFAF